ncbi:MAG: alpha-N-arabinofuranosidase, partial [Aristaeellaceae bacterium]
NPGYIANMRDTATAGFKYFDCKGVKRVSVRTKGYAAGRLEIRTALDAPAVGAAPVSRANVWHDTVAEADIPDGVHALYFTFSGAGFLQFAAFTLLTD